MREDCNDGLTYFDSVIFIDGWWLCKADCGGMIDVADCLLLFYCCNSYISYEEALLKMLN